MTVKKNQSKKPSDKEKEAAKCPKCSALWPSKSDICSNCGHVRERKNDVIVNPGELIEIGSPAKKRKKNMILSIKNRFISSF